jgi:hypothetical protein
MKSAENFIVSSVFSKSLSVLESLLRCWFRGYRVLLRDHSVFSFICALIRVVCIGHSSILGASDLLALAVAAGSSLANDNLFSGVFFSHQSPGFCGFSLYMNCTLQLLQ